MKLFWRKPPKKPVEPAKPALPWSHLTLDGWRSSDVRINFATKLFSSKLGQDMIAVLQNTMPVPDISDAARAGLEGARVRGYMQAIATLIQMQVPLPAVQALPEPDYSGTVEESILIEETA